MTQSYASENILAEDPFKAFDDDNNTQWSTNGSAMPQWLAYDFGAGNEKCIVEFVVQ